MVANPAFPPDAFELRLGPDVTVIETADHEPIAYYTKVRAVLSSIESKLRQR